MLILQNKLKNVIVVFLNMFFVLTHRVAIEKFNENEIYKRTLKIVKLKNKKIEITFDAKNQQFKHSEIRAIYNDKNYYEIFFEFLLTKLIKIQIKNLMMNKIKKQLILKNYCKICVERN